MKSGLGLGEHISVYKLYTIRIPMTKKNCVDAIPKYGMIFYGMIRDFVAFGEIFGKSM